MALPPPRDHRIPLAQAADLTRTYRASAADGSTIAGFYHRAAVDDLLRQAGCVGVRFYYGRDADGAMSLVLVGVDADGNDLATGTLVDFHFPCPPFCGVANPLNG